MSESADSTRDRWDELWERFHLLAEVDAADRDRSLRELAVRDPELAAELQSLLASHDTPHPLVDRPESLLLVAGDEPSLTEAPEGELRIGSRLGHYVLIEKIGEGGMGVVFLAERADASVEQRVAVKLLSGVTADPSMIERFRREREILARLDHPSIARLIDVGDDESGRPFVVMEYVDGEPIDAHCRRTGLDLRGRLELMIQVCSVVDAAHRSLVVHRDLKPSNVLVTADGVPKLVDFGIARRLDSADATIGTSRVLTPRWASPEQLLGEPVTTAADVYALGLLLCHLLTGRLPYRAADAPLPVLTREVVEEPALRPSELVGEGEDTSAARQRSLRGDLDAIVGRALEKEPDRRYRTAADLAEDLRRHRDGFPIAARAPGLGLRLRKLVARHRIATAASAVFAVTILGLAVVTTVLNVRLNTSLEAVRAERANAGRQRRIAVETADFLQDLFRSVAPGEARGAEPTLREIVDLGAARLTEVGRDGETQDPATRAELMLTLSEVYASLSVLDRSLELASSAEEIARSLDAPLLLAESLAAESRVRHALGEYRESVELLERAVERYESSPEVPVAQLVVALSDLGSARIGLEDGEGAEMALRRALELAGTGSQRQAAVARLRLGSLLRERGELAEARGLLDAAVRDLEATMGSDHPDSLQARKELADTLRAQGEHREAAAVLSSVLATAERVYGEDHADLAPILDRLSVIHQSLEERDVAERYQRRSLAIRELRLGRHSARTTVSVNNLGWLLHDGGHYAEAAALYRRALETGEATVGPEHPSVAIALNNLGLLALDRGRPSEAVPLLRRSIAILEQRLGKEHPARAYPLTNLGVALLDLDQPGAAEAPLEEALRLRRERLPAGHQDLRPTLVAYGRLLCEAGRPEAGEAAVREALGIERGLGRPGSFGEAIVEIELGACLLVAGDRESGRSLVEASLPRIEARRGSEDPRLARGRRLLAASR